MLSAPLRVAVMCSRRAPGLTHLLARAKDAPLPWRIVCCLTSEETFEEQGLVERARIPIIRHPARRFYAEHAPMARFSDLGVRQEYDAMTTLMLTKHWPDIVLLSGYLLKLTGPMLETYDRRILNVHHADLLLRDDSGAPRYPGLRAVRDAILAGERETRCTVHVVTEQLDDGPVLLRSGAFPVPEAAAWARARGEADVLKPIIWAQQEWMLREAFGPLMEQTLGLDRVESVS